MKNGPYYGSFPEVTVITTLAVFPVLLSFIFTSVFPSLFPTIFPSLS